MSCYLVYTEKAHKMMRPVNTREEYLSLRNAPMHRQNVAMARQGKEGYKKLLMQMNYSCLPTTDDNSHPGCGPLKGCQTLSNTVGMDVDLHRAEYESDEAYLKALAEIPEKVLEKKEELGLLMLERSVTKGYHLVFRRHPELSQEDNLRWASSLLGVEYDKGAKDITRVFFTTTASEEDLLYLDDELFDQSPKDPTPTLPREGVCETESATHESATHESAMQEDTQGNAHDLTMVSNNSSPRGGQEGVTYQGNAHDLTMVSNNSSPRGGQEGVTYQGNAHDLTMVSNNSSPRGGQEGVTYQGILYDQIIKKWWDLYNDGKEPEKSNRNTLTFELAVNLRHICGFDRELMKKVIPCYDGFAESEKMACIDSALNEKRTQMPKRLKDVIAALQQDILKGNLETGADTLAAIDQMNANDELYHFDHLPKMPQGVRDSIDAAGHSLAMATLIAIAPAIGALATGVKLYVHGKARGLNLCSFVVGEFASGKGQLDDIIAAWMYELQDQTNRYTQQEEEWALKTKRMKSGTAPEQPKLPVRMLTLNNTVANIAERLSNAEGKHSFSFTPEADNVALKWKQSVSDFSVMLRQAYDEARYDREAKSADAVRVHIEKLLWNVTMCGTQDALYRVITNYTDGLLSRLAIARTPDNTFAPLADNPAQLTDQQKERIQEIAHILPLMNGMVELPKLEQRGREWLEVIRMESMKNDDRVLARQRMRGCVNAQRITTALWLPKVAELLIKKHGLNGAEKHLKQNPELWMDMLCKLQTDEMMQLFDLIADYLIDNDLYFFRERIENAYESKNYRGNVGSVRNRKGKNDSIFERLASEFTFEQAYQQSVAVKGVSATRNSVHQMLKNWRSQGIIVVKPEGVYGKV